MTLRRQSVERKVALPTHSYYAHYDSTDNSPQLHTLSITYGLTDMSGPDSSIKQSNALSVLHSFNTYPGRNSSKLSIVNEKHPTGFFIVLFFSLFAFRISLTCYASVCPYNKK